MWTSWEKRKNELLHSNFNHEHRKWVSWNCVLSLKSEQMWAKKKKNVILHIWGLILITQSKNFGLQIFALNNLSMTCLNRCRQMLWNPNLKFLWGAAKNEKFIKVECDVITRYVYMFTDRLHHAIPWWTLRQKHSLIKFWPKQNFCTKLD